MDHASEIDGIDELHKQSGIMDQHKGTLNDFQDPAEAKKKAVEAA